MTIDPSESLEPLASKDIANSEALFTGTLELSLKELGPEHKFIKIILNNSTPEKVAPELIGKTKLDRNDVRKKLIKGGEKAVKRSKDPLIVFARKLDPYLRRIEKWEDRMKAFWTLRPHPSFTQIKGITEPFPEHRPSVIHPISLTLDELDTIIKYARTIEPADLGPDLGMD